jgi:drug/metabolite transporter (DMT)-like permease
MSAVRLSQLRSAVAFALLLGGLALFSPGRLRVDRRDILKLAWLGIAGIALVHATYFAAIARIRATCCWRSAFRPSAR